jgi:hypothetical protein
MKHIESTLIVFAASAPAIAEVCDKERPAWNPQAGQSRLTYALAN